MTMTSAAYVGEWDQKRRTEEAPRGDGREYLLSIVRAPDGIDDSYAFWKSLASGSTSIFVVECLVCTRKTAIDQLY